MYQPGNKPCNYNTCKGPHYDISNEMLSYIYPANADARYPKSEKKRKQTELLSFSPALFHEIQHACGKTCSGGCMCREETVFPTSLFENLQSVVYHEFIPAGTKTLHGGLYEIGELIDGKHAHGYGNQDDYSPLKPDPPAYIPK